jgi:putative acetyltransferase
MLRITSAETEEAIARVSALFREYAAGLSVNLSFQDFESELTSLPGEYALPDSRLLLAYSGDGPDDEQESALAGCVALRRIDGDTCEMKRLYVRAYFRGQGAGRALALAVIAAAREIGYRFMRLDTLPEMSQAQTLYRSLGFREIPPYRFNPVAGARFLELPLV